MAEEIAFRHWVFQVPKYHYVPKYKVETLYLGTGTMSEFWCVYLEKGVITLVLSENRLVLGCPV